LVLRKMMLLSRVSVAQNPENAVAFSKSIITNVHNNKKENGHQTVSVFFLWLREEDSELWFCAEWVRVAGCGSAKPVKMLSHFPKLSF